MSRDYKNYEKAYSDGVLLGNWFEDTVKYVPQPIFRCTTYLMDYRPPQIEKHDPSTLWDISINMIGSGPRILIDHNGYKFHDNFSTTYDLSYRVHPDKPFTENFGNITQYGLKEAYKDKWADETRELTNSEYRDHFTPPPADGYEKNRLAKPRENSSSLEPINLLQLRLRGKLISILPQNSKPSPYSRTCSNVF